MQDFTDFKLNFAWARRQLGLPAADAPGQVRGALLRRLARDRFIPPIPVDMAFRVLQGGLESVSGNFGSQHVQGHVESDLRQRLAALGQVFFQLGPDARRKAWEGLKALCQDYPQLLARLSFWEKGLGVEPELLSGPQQTLARMLCELFVLEAEPRTVRRRRLQIEIAQNQAFWKSTAQDLERHDPRYQHLNHALWQTITKYQERAHAARKAARARNPNWLEWIAATVGILILVGFFAMRISTMNPSGSGIVTPGPLDPETQQWFDNFVRQKIIRQPNFQVQGEEAIKNLFPGLKLKDHDSGPSFNSGPK